ncbi:MAG: hypothetical protein IJY56_04065 [Clostridia bacterium]|nr:hypothetical protein [Clostridia bacterium]
MTGKFRTKCPSCGEVYDLTAVSPCKKCGTALAPLGGMIKLYRMGSPIGIAAGFGIYINGQPFGHIGNKQTVYLSLPFGAHNVHITCGMTRRCNDIIVNLTPETPIGYLKTSIRPGFWTNSIDITPAMPQDVPD